MEILDIVDEQGEPTGERVERSEAHLKGIRHRTAHIWITREHNGRRQILLQKRAMTKDSFPGKYDTSSAGHVQAGDAILDSARRELHEELGISAKENELEFAGKFRIQYESEFHNMPFKDNEIAFVYVYMGEVDINSLTLQAEELDQVEWFDLEETCAACKAHDPRFCVPVHGLETAKAYLDQRYPLAKAER